MDRPLPWLKYVNAGDLDDDMVDFDGMNVESQTGEHLGDVDGFIVDSESGRPYYVVAEAGWFKTKHFLLPVGHVRLDTDPEGEALVADVPKDRIERFPGFDKDEFDKLTEADLKRINDEICIACSAAGATVAYDSAEPYSAAWNRPAYRYPSWWTAEPRHPDRMGERAVTAGVEVGEDEAVGTDTARHPDQSPHFGGRAQPGDVIGIETGGEQTHIGETARDEDHRREDAQEAVDKEPVGDRR